MIGGFLGGVVVWLAYLPHWEVTEDKAAKLGVFCTGPGHPQDRAPTCSRRSSAPSCWCSACWRFSRPKNLVPNSGFDTGFAPLPRRCHRLGHRSLARRPHRIRDQSGARSRAAPRALRAAHRRQGRFRLGLRLDSRRRPDHRRSARRRCSTKASGPRDRSDPATRRTSPSTPMKYILALDQGTTSSRAIVFDHAGSIVAVGAEGVPPDLPQARLGGA